MPTAVNLIGQRFDKLVVTGVHANTCSGTIWACACDCGETCNKMTTQLHRGGYIGCKACEPLSRSMANARHGESLGKSMGGKTKLYMVWKGMHSRCRDKGNTSFRYYGGKGIGVDPRWSNFEQFRQWAHDHGYLEGLSIDRLNASQNYSPENCEFVTRGENSRRMMADRKAGQ